MKPSVTLCDKIRCPKFWPFDHRCNVTGLVPGHMDRCPSNRLNSYEDMIEVLAELEHKQWVYWSKTLAKSGEVPVERYTRWKRLWKPYTNLTENEKEQDRIWAKKVLDALLKEKYVEITLVEEEDVR